jgi:UDP-glucose 4-epimerase
MKFLLLGGAGFIGLNLTHSLLAGGHSVSVLDNFSFSEPPENKVDNFVWSSADVSNDRAVESFMAAIKPDIVFWLPAVQHYRLKEPTLQTAWLNYSLNKIIPVLVKHNIKRFFLASSDLVYKPDKALLTETSKLNWGVKKTIPANKLISEWYTVSLCQQLKLPFILLRFSNIVGDKKFVTSISDRLLFMVDRLLVGENYILEKPDQKLDYLHIDNAVEMIFNIIKSEKSNQAYNISSGLGIANAELYQAVADIMKVEELPKVVKTREASLVLSNKKVSSLGRVNLINIREILPHLIESRRKMLRE